MVAVVQPVFKRDVIPIKDRKVTLDCASGTRKNSMKFWGFGVSEFFNSNECKAVIGFDLTVLAQAKRPFLKCYCDIRGVTLLGAFGLLINRTLAVCIAADQRVCACLA